MYEQEIARIKDDLGIAGLVIEWTWLKRKYVSRQYTGTYYHQGGRPRIAVALKGWSYKQVVLIIAHELRHAWQYATLTYHPDTCAWSGTQFAGPVAEMSYKTPYRKRAIEVDAYAYQDDCWTRLFEAGSKKKKASTPAGTLALMFDTALGAR